MLKASVERARSSTRGLTANEEARFWIRNRCDQDGFEVKDISDEVGKGVFATKIFEQGDFLLEYVGEVLGKEEASRRRRVYKRKGMKRWYMYDFRHNEKTLV